MIVAVSDLHLGTPYSDKSLFTTFLDDVVDTKEVDHFVLVGDILDMWRGTPSTTLEAHKNVLKKVSNLQKRRKIYYVVGNHDYHMLRRKSDIFKWYNLNVYESVTLPYGDQNYFFIHGYQFEFPDTQEVYEELANLLCLGGDVVGATVAYFWNLHEKIRFIVHMQKTWFSKTFENVIKPPEERLTRKDMDKINNTIKEWRKDDTRQIKDTFIVYGHTHQPTMDGSRREANTGSWVDDPHYTHLEKNKYITIKEDGTVKLETYSPSNLK